MKGLSAHVVLVLALAAIISTIPPARSLAAPLRRSTHHSTSTPPAATPRAPSHDAPWVMQRPDVYVYTHMVVPHNSISGTALARYGLHYVGYPYTLTGNSPTLGFSCIGFVSYVYESFGIPLPDDLWNGRAYAPAVPFRDLRPGDILWFGNTVWPGLSHTAIYIGGGRFVHAAWFGVGVIVSSFSNDPRYGNYWTTHYMGATRPWGGAGSQTSSFSAFIARRLYPDNLEVVPGAPVVLVTAPFQRLRRWWALSAPIIRRVPRATPLFPLKREGYWYEVSTPDGLIGWIPTAESVPFLSSDSPAGTGQSRAVQADFRPRRAGRRKPAHARVRRGTSHHKHSSRLHAGAQAAADGAANSMSVPPRIENNPTVAQGDTAVISPTATVGDGSRVSAGTGSTLKAADTTGPTGTSAQTNTTTAGSDTWKVATQVTHVLSGESANASVLQTLNLGDAYQVVSVRGDSERVTLLDGQTGWILWRAAETVHRTRQGQHRRKAVRGRGATRKRVARSIHAATHRAASRHALVHYRSRLHRSSGSARTQVTVKLHLKPGIHARVLTLVPRNTVVLMLGKSGQWVHVRLRSGLRGYVYGAYLRGP